MSQIQVDVEDEALDKEELQEQDVNNEVTESETEGSQEENAQVEDQPADHNEEESAANEQALEQNLKETKEAINDATALLNDKGLNYDALVSEYDQNGVLSEDTYKKLADAGYPKNVVDTFIRGVEATNEGFTNAVYGFAGGKAEYEKLTAYVTSKGKEAVDGFNTIITNGSLASVKMMINGLKAEMTMRSGTAKGSLLGGNSGGNMGGFANEAAMEKAMSDPRYGVDEAYTKAVEQRLIKSPFISFNK